MAAAEQLNSTIDYRFVGHRQQVDAAQRVLTWVATIEGALNGAMNYWCTQQPPAPSTETAHTVIHFYAGRWEIFDGDALLLAGESAGRTVFPAGGDGIWDGHGVVLETGSELAALLGRRSYETGPVLRGDNPPQSFHGRGLFSIC